MGFLWGLLTFLITIFSTSQLISYMICCFSRYPEMMVGMSKENKQGMIGGIILHVCINIIWLILVCVVPTIRAYWWVCLIVFVVSLIISILGVRDDEKLKDNFANATGYSQREKIKHVLEEYRKEILDDEKK